jgi:hypothetical protein
MRHALSADDRHFRAEFEAGRFPPDRFDHRSHVRLAYVYLAEHDTDAAVTLLRGALQSWLAQHRVDPAKYHETITRAWILAVRHFMETSAGAASADAFIDAHPLLLDRKIMLTHYSADLLFSNEARARFVEPDLDEIPRHPG